MKNCCRIYFGKLDLALRLDAGFASVREISCKVINRRGQLLCFWMRQVQSTELNGSHFVWYSQTTCLSNLHLISTGYHLLSYPVSWKIHVTRCVRLRATMFDLHNTSTYCQYVMQLSYIISIYNLPVTKSFIFWIFLKRMSWILRHFEYNTIAVPSKKGFVLDLKKEFVHIRFTVNLFLNKINLEQSLLFIWGLRREQVKLVSEVLHNTFFSFIHGRLSLCVHELIEREFHRRILFECEEFQELALHIF